MRVVPGAALSAHDHIASYYAASAPAGPLRPALSGDIDCDVCVVGGGISGCSTALHLAERGYRVVLLESQRIGWGASGRSGAQALFGIACGEEKIEKLVGDEDARRIWDVTLEGLDLLRARIERHSIDCDWVPGHMNVAVKPRQVQALREWLARLATRYDYTSMRMVERDELRSLVQTDRYLAGTYDPNCGHLHPLRYTQGLARAAEAAGCVIHEGSHALSYESRAGGVRVRTASGSVRAKYLALCGNAWLGATAPQIRSRIMPVGTYIVATEPIGEERARALISNDAAVADTNFVLDYFRRSRDHRLLFGGRVSYSGLDPFNTAKATRRRMVQVFPQLEDARIDYSWGGYVDITMNRAPDFGRLEPNVYYLQGFSGHGIALAGIAGKLMSEVIAGNAERFDLLEQIQHRPFPGGEALRRPALVLAMLYYRMRDLL